MGSVYYKQLGDGPALVFLHGFCESHEIWDETAPELSSGCSVITLDLPGFGKSAILKSPFSIKEVGHAVIEFIETFGIQKFGLIGHSLGGYVALAIAKERPDLVAGLCLFHSTAQPDSEEKRINRNKVIDFVEKNGVRPFIETFVPGLFFQQDAKKVEKVYTIASRTSKKALLGYVQAMRDRPDMTDFLRTFKSPLLFLAGENDSIIPLSALRDQTKASLNGKLKILSETGHMGMFEDTIHANEILKNFAKGCFQNAGR